MRLDLTALVSRSEIEIAENRLRQLLMDPSWQLGMSADGLYPRTTAVGISFKIARAS